MLFILSCIITKMIIMINLIDTENFVVMITRICLIFIVDCTVGKNYRTML